jgi:hypothetical protein
VVHVPGVTAVNELGYCVVNAVRYELTARLDVDATDIPVATKTPKIASKTRLLLISDLLMQR